MTMTRVFYCKEKYERVDLSWEFGGEGGQQRILYVPLLERWKREMPAWSIDRRDEIVPRILVLSERRGISFIVHEY